MERKGGEEKEGIREEEIDGKKGKGRRRREERRGDGGKEGKESGRLRQEREGEEGKARGGKGIGWMEDNGKVSKAPCWSTDECLYTRYNRLSYRFDNTLTTACIV